MFSVLSCACRSGLSRLKAARIRRRPLRSQTSNASTAASLRSEPEYLHQQDVSQPATPPKERSHASSHRNTLRTVSSRHKDSSPAPTRRPSIGPPGKRASKPAWAGVFEEGPDELGTSPVIHSAGAHSQAQQQSAASDIPKGVRRQSSGTMGQTGARASDLQTVAPSDGMSRIVTKRVGKAASLRQNRSLRPAWQDPTPPLDPEVREPQHSPLDRAETLHGQHGDQSVIAVTDDGTRHQATLPHAGQQHKASDPTSHTTGDRPGRARDTSSAARTGTNQGIAAVSSRVRSGASSGSESSTGSETTSKGSETTSASSEAAPAPEAPSARNTPFVPKQPPRSGQRPQRVAPGLALAAEADMGRGKENEQHAALPKNVPNASMQDASGAGVDHGLRAAGMDGIAEQPTEFVQLQVGFELNPMPSGTSGQQYCLQLGFRGNCLAGRDKSQCLVALPAEAQHHDKNT